MKMHEKIINLLLEINPYEEIECDTLLLEEEILDSLTLVLFITVLEKEFGVRIPEEKLKPEYFESVNKIADLITSIAL